MEDAFSDGNKIDPKNTTNLDFQVVDHSLAEFYRDVFSNGVVEADDILGRLGIFGLQGDHHILVKFLQLHRNADAVLKFTIITHTYTSSLGHCYT